MNYVDISSNNPTPNLQAYYNAGHRDLMLKATEGTGYSWAQMQTLAQQWHTLPGTRVGYYHWLYATASADAQFNWFWSQVSGVFRPGDWFMTDFEDTDPSRWMSDATHLAVLKRFNDLARTKAPIHTYTGNWYLSNLPLCAAYLKTQPVVMSDYSNNPPANPYGLSYVAHQFTDRATVAGMPAPVDYNRWLADSSLGGGVPISTPASPEVDLLPEERDWLIAVHAAVTQIIQPGIVRDNGRDADEQAALAALKNDVGAIQATVGRIDTNAYGTYKAVQLVLDALAKVQPSPTPAGIDYAALAAAFRSELSKTPLAVTGTVTGSAA